jgi:hypothetical protein
MTIKFATTLQNSRANQITSALGTTAVLNIYSGTRPATPGTALSGNTLLASCSMSNPVAAGASAGTLTFSTITLDNAAAASGTAVWASLVDGSGNRWVDLDVSAVGGGGDLQLNTTTIVVGGPVLITSFTLTETA